jgi:acetyl-CoA carboxylase biotin carboxylase subunit
MDEKLRNEMGEVAIAAARACSYTNAGTVEFLLDENKNYFFLEMNTRLQVEHPITEMITGVDVVAQQIKISQQESLEGFSFSRRGASLECRIYAEDPEKNFLPSPGHIKRLTNPAGPGVRNDSGVYSGYTIPLEYDPMISKLVVWGETREQARLRMLRALEEYHILGIKTNISYLRNILGHQAFISGNYDTHFITNFKDELSHRETTQQEAVALAAAAIISMVSSQKKKSADTSSRNTVSTWKRSGWKFDGEE